MQMMGQNMGNCCGIRRSCGEKFHRRSFHCKEFASYLRMLKSSAG